MQGIHVLDLTRVLAGPWAAQQLADQGAEVIKVEPPWGDQTRHFGPFKDGQSTYFLSANRNKRSIVLDLKTEGGQSILHRLIAWADVVIENFRPGVAERLGFGWEALRLQRPELIYVGVHAFGDDAQESQGWSNRPGYDLVLQAMGGAATITGEPGSGPLKHGNSTADITTGLLTVQAVLLGLLHRERTGEGQKIVVNMLQTQAACLTYHATRYAVTGEVEQSRGNGHRGLVPYNIYPCKDGWIALACGSDPMWSRLTVALGIPNKSEWNQNIGRIQDRTEIDALIREATHTLSVVEADALFSEIGVPSGPVLSPDATLEHPAVQTIGVSHPVLGDVLLPGPMLQTQTTRTVHMAPPIQDQHRAEILLGLGLSHSAIEQYAEEGAFGATSNRSN